MRQAPRQPDAPHAKGSGNDYLLMALSDAKLVQLTNLALISNVGKNEGERIRAPFL